jgi:hypothetical protein
MNVIQPLLENNELNKFRPVTVVITDGGGVLAAADGKNPERSTVRAFLQLFWSPTMMASAHILRTRPTVRRLVVVSAVWHSRQRTTV